MDHRSPRKGTKAASQVRGTSPKNFCWGLQMETVLLELFIREDAIGNRVGGTFTLTAYKNIVEELNIIFATQINKNHVQNKLRLLKSHYAQFKNAFASMSGFAWNVDSKRFEAEDDVWDTMIKENPSISALRFKTVNNWDKLDQLFSTTIATGSMSHSGRDMNERTNRRLDVDSVDSDLEFRPTNRPSQSQNFAYASGYQSNPTESDKEPSAPHSGSHQSSGYGKSKRKFTQTEQSTLEKASDKMLLGMEKMCSAIMTGAKQISRIDGDRNVNIFKELKALNLRRSNLLRCYRYLCDNSNAASAFLSLLVDFREEMFLLEVGSDTDTP